MSGKENFELHELSKSLIEQWCNTHRWRTVGGVDSTAISHMAIQGHVTKTLVLGMAVGLAIALRVASLEVCDRDDT